MTNSLAEPLLVETQNGECGIQKDGKEREKVTSLVTEFRRQLGLAGPMIIVNILQFALSLVSVMFVGHLGELALASASIATSFGNVTGFSLLTGMSSALETLCGQANGAKQYHKLGIYLQRAIFVLFLTCIPITFVFLSMGSILRAVGQDPEISYYAGQYARYMIPTLFAYACLPPLVRFLQSQSAVLPMAVCSTCTLCIHVPVCYLLIYKLGVGYRGAAIAAAISQWFNVTCLILYVKFSPTCKNSWKGFSSEAFQDMKAFFSLALPSAGMICLEYWSFELMVLMSGLLPNPQLEMSSLAISLNTIALMYMIPAGLSASVSIRVSNELGAGNPTTARRAVIVGCSMGFGAGLVLATMALLLRNVWGYAYTNDIEVVNYVAILMPLLSIMTVLDCFQAVLCGVTRGCGLQKLGAYANLCAYYIVGVPLAILLAFHFHLNGRGLWIGMITALSLQAMILLSVILCINWEKQAQDAADRVYSHHLPIASPDGAIVGKVETDSS